MTATSFDSARAVRFDLPRGAVQAGSDDERVILIPSSALDDLALSVPPEAVDALGRSLGTSIGKRAVARVPDARSASVEEFVTQLAGEAAVAGIGVLTVERWGRALVVVIEASPLASAWLAPVIASALSVAFPIPSSKRSSASTRSFTFTTKKTKPNPVTAFSSVKPVP